MILHSPELFKIHAKQFFLFLWILRRISLIIDIKRVHISYEIRVLRPIFTAGRKNNLGKMFSLKNALLRNYLCIMYTMQNGHWMRPTTNLLDFFFFFLNRMNGMSNRAVSYRKHSSLWEPYRTEEILLLKTFRAEVRANVFDTICLRVSRGSICTVTNLCACDLHSLGIQWNEKGLWIHTY